MRNNPSPAILIKRGELQLLDDPSEAVGSRNGIRPLIHETALHEDLWAVLFTDGLIHAGERSGQQFPVERAVSSLHANKQLDPGDWANRLLDQARSADEGRPGDDITVLVAAIRSGSTDGVRRMTVSTSI